MPTSLSPCPSVRTVVSFRPLSDYDSLPAALDALLGDVAPLAEVGNFTETPLEELKRGVEVNRWTNKAVMDWLHGWGRPID